MMDKHLLYERALVTLEPLVEKHNKTIKDEQFKLKAVRSAISGIKNLIWLEEENGSLTERFWAGELYAV